MIPRLYVPKAINPLKPVELDAGQRRYLTRTLRLNAGDKLIIFNGEGDEGEWQAELSQNTSQVNLLKFIPLKKESPLKITLIHGLAKGNITEMVIQKAVELGAVTMIPLVAKRSVRRSIKDRKDNKLKRWQNIVIEAVEQCGRVRIPKVHSPVNWQDLAEILPKEGPRYLFWEEEGVTAIKLNELPHPGESVTLLIGPEGGLSVEEVAMAKEQLGFTVVGLGPRVLRVATAGVAVVGSCQLLWGDMG
ncbi:MAG: 16S rRNA (uracil(1498)-N(3))-methyltransferase [Magnetococcales bacterium]|nr:16S rRNA (uracil(1498)-N(3))-methyltransferase [Magnetococcales bacterium]